MRHRLRKRRERRGVALLVALVSLGVIATLIGLQMRVLLAAGRSADRRATQLQLEWLTTSAIERTSVAMALDENYGGETWEVSMGDGRVAIVKIDRAPRNPQVRIEARVKESLEDVAVVREVELPRTESESKE